MSRVPRRGISNDELDKALAASRRHAAFADNAGEGGSQVQAELRMIAARADHIASHAPGDLRPKRSARRTVEPRPTVNRERALICGVECRTAPKRSTIEQPHPKGHHPMPWRTTWGVVAACMAVAAVAAVVVGASVLHEVGDPGQDGSASALLAVAVTSVYTFAFTFKFLRSPIGTGLLAKGVKSLDRHVTGIRARWHREEERSRPGDTVTDC
jgi:hypothetical protein